MNYFLLKIKRMIGFLIGFPSLISNLIDDLRKRRRCIVLKGAILYPCSRISNNQERNAIVIGKNSKVLAMLETLGHGGRIEIGSNCFIGEGTRIWSATFIRIGNRVLISHNVNIHDSNSHSISAASRAQHFDTIFSIGHPKVLPDVPSESIAIENDAWIGFGASILKGVTIGEGAIVGAHSMVTKNVEPYTIVVGNPARIIGRSER